MLRSLKKEQEKNTKVAISKDSLNSNQALIGKKLSVLEKITLILHQLLMVTLQMLK